MLFTPVALAIPTEMAIEFEISWMADEPLVRHRWRRM